MKLWVVDVVLVTAADVTRLVIMPEHAKEALAYRLAHDVVSDALSTLSLVLLTEFG